MKQKIYLLFIFIVIAVTSANAQYLRETLDSKTKKKVEIIQQLKGKRNFKSEFTNPKSKSLALIYKAQKESSDFWNQNMQKWDTTNFVQYTYDNNGNVLTKIFHDYLLGPQFREIMTYDAKNQLVQLVNAELNNGVWKDYFKLTFEYDNNGNNTLFLVQQWDDVANAFLNIEREIVEFNAQNQLIFSSRESYVNNAWLMFFGVDVDRVYDQNQLLKQETAIFYNSNTYTWDSTQRNTFERYSNGYLKSFNIELYNLANNTWENMFKEIYELDANNIVDTILSCDYDIDNSKWDTLGRLVNIEWFNFNGDVNTSEFKTYTTQIDTGTGLINQSRSTITKTDNYGSHTDVFEGCTNNNFYIIDRFTRNYDSRYTYYELKYEEFINGAYEISDHVRRDITYDNNNTITQFVVNELDFFTRILTPTQRIRFEDFVSFSVGFENKKLNEVKIYPNPTISKSSISFELKNESDVKIEIYNMLGELVDNSNYGIISKGEHVFTSPDLQSGLYIIKVIIDNENYKTILLVE